MIRKTASPERYMLFFGNRYPIYFSFVVRVKGNLSDEALRDALLLLKTRHVLCSVRSILAKNKDQFLTNDEVGEFEIRHFPDDKRSWDQIVLDLLSCPFNVAKGPFIRFGLRYLNGQTELYTVFHHAFSDGVSGIIFLKDLFKTLSGNPPLDPLPQDGLFLFQALKPEVDLALAKREKPGWATEKPEAKGQAIGLPFSSPAFKIHSHELNRSEVSRLLACAKTMQISVHSLLGAVFLKTYAGIFGPDTGYARTIQTPVDCRKYLKEEYKNSIGAFNSIIKMPIDCSPAKSIKEISQEIGRGLSEKTSNYKDIEEFYHFKDFFEDIPDPEAVMSEFKPDPLDYDFSLSNLGRIDLAPSYGQWEIESIYGPTFTAINGEQVVGLNTHNGIMRFTYIYDKDLFKEEIGNSIWKRSFDLLQELIAAK
jgi:NRPS condensation-like uncharacterized protein